MKKRFVLNEISENIRFDYGDKLYYTTVMWVEFKTEDGNLGTIPLPLEYPDYTDEFEEELAELKTLDKKTPLVLELTHISSSKYKITDIVSVNDL